MGIEQYRWKVRNCWILFCELYCVADVWC